MDQQPRQSEDGAGEFAVFDTVRWAIWFVFDHFGHLLKVSATPFLLLFLIAISEHAILVAFPAMRGPLTALVFQLLQAAVLVPQATSWHRFALLDDERLRWFQFSVGLREVRFCGYTFLGYGGLLIAGFAGVQLYRALAEFATVIQVLLAVVVIWFLARFATVLPATALGVQFSLREAYRSTRGYIPKIMGIYIVTAFIMTTFGLGFDALGAVAASFFSHVTPWTTIVAETAPRAFFNLLSVGVSISILSAIFRHVAGTRSTDPA